MFNLGCVGHQPFPGVLSNDFDAEDRLRLRKTILAVYRQILSHSPFVLRCPASSGFELDCMYVAYKLGVPYQLTLISPAHASKWGDSEHRAYMEVISRDKYEPTHFVVNRTQDVKPDTYLRRNEIVISMSDWILAFLGKESGGTFHTMELAGAKGIPATIISPIPAPGSELLRVFHYPEGYHANVYFRELTCASI